MDLNQNNGHFLEYRIKSRHEWWLWLGPYILWALIFIPALFSHDPWAFDELRYMEVSRQTGEYGNWLVLHINGRLYPEKPPFFFWCTAIVQKLIGGGSWVVAGRLTVALAVLGCVVQLQSLGRWMFQSQRIGAFAAALMLTFIFLIDTGTRILLDPFFMALTTAATVALLRAGESQSRKRWLIHLILASVWLTAACMTKGPVAIVISLLLAFVIGWRWLGWSRVSFVACGLATAAALGVTVGWVYLVSLEVGPQFLDQMIFKQVVGRAKHAHHHGKPIWTHLANSPRMLTPWLVFLPAAVWGAIARRRQLWVRRANAVGLGVLAVFIFFSMMSGKRMGYLTPLYPFVALFLAVQIRVLWLQRSSIERSLGFTLPAALATLIPFVTGSAFVGLGMAIRMGLADNYIEPGNALLEGLRGGRAAFMLLAGLICLTLGLQVLLQIKHRKFEHAGMLILISVGLTVATMHVTVYRASDGANSGRGLHRAAQKVVPENARMVMLDDHKDGLVNYYWNTERHEVVRTEKLFAEAQKPGTLYVVALEKQWKRVPPETTERFELIVSWKFAGHPRNIYREIEFHK
ncbi:MAG: ArnT family glycosyltransferase [Planctomycetota bacterium]|jgi:4-amino-4-deoxy-L-arabinose transferase-like glycosyltransferase